MWLILKIEFLHLDLNSYPWFTWQKVLYLTGGLVGVSKNDICLIYKPFFILKSFLFLRMITTTQLKNGVYVYVCYTTPKKTNFAVHESPKDTVIPFMT